MRYCFLAIFLGLFIFMPVHAATDQRGLAAVEKNRDSRKRVALVVGNSNYLSSPLKNPANDARTMARTLRKLGFEVDEKTDLNYFQFNEAVENFGNRLKTGGVGLFYYAGHGMQVQGNNYLIPVDAKMKSENEVRYKAIDAGLVLAKMEQAKSDVNIVVLDACRDNPFGRSFRSSSHGLANMEAPNGTIIAYATAPGKTASDGEGGSNGLYTAELARVLETPGLKVEDVFKRVLRGVREKSANAQIPWLATSFEGDFYFTSPSGMTDLQPSPVQAKPLEAYKNPPAENERPKTYAKENTAKHSLVLMETSMGNVKLELFDQESPISVRNFLNYVANGFYSDTILHRVISRFIIQGGGFSSDFIRKNTNAPIKSESSNGLKNLRGTIATARTKAPDSANSQFFINVVNNDGSLDPPNNDGHGYSAVFGKVVDGMEVVDLISKVRTGDYKGSKDVPVDPVVIKSIRVLN